MSSVPTKNIYWRDLPNYGFVTLEGKANKYYVWNGHKRGKGRHRCLINWMSIEAVVAQRKLDSLVKS